MAPKLPVVQPALPPAGRYPSQLELPHRSPAPTARSQYPAQKVHRRRPVRLVPRAHPDRHAQRLEAS